MMKALWGSIDIALLICTVGTRWW